MNGLGPGTRSPEYIAFVQALVNAPTGCVEATVRAILVSKRGLPPLFREAAELALWAEARISGRLRTLRACYSRKSVKGRPKSSGNR
jgi:hypothetical protein